MQSGHVEAGDRYSGSFLPDGKREAFRGQGSPFAADPVREREIYYSLR